jgi:hypothetical protein
MISLNKFAKKPILSSLLCAHSSRYPTHCPSPYLSQPEQGLKVELVTSKRAPFPRPPAVPHVPLHGWPDPQTPGSLVWMPQLWWTTNLWRDEILSLPLEESLNLTDLRFPHCVELGPADSILIPPLLECPEDWVRKHFLELAMPLAVCLKVP